MRARLAAALGALILVSGCDNAQKTDEPSLPPPRIISGPVSVAATCTGPSPSARPAEPSLAADPGDPRQLVVGWLENPAGTVVALSHDGGATWSRTPLPGLLTCAGGRYTRTSDPWVSIGPDGVTYVAVLGIGPSTPDGALYHDIVVTVSRDHGSTWETPVVVERATAPPMQPDKEAILADPRHPGTAYVAWVDYKVTAGVDPTVDQVMFARTSDGGRSWSTPAAIYSGNDEAQQNQLLITAAGVLLDVFVEGPSLPFAAHPPPLPVKIRVMRSTDQGTSWSVPIDAAGFTYTVAVVPGTEAPLRVSGQNITATAAGNAVYASWFEDHADFSTIQVARSEDGGLHWRKPQVVVREKAEAILPTLAVAGDATIGLLWFDFRGFKPGSTRLDTDVWFSTSRDRGAHWTKRRAAGPFDMLGVPGGRTGPFIGDYMGLVGLPDGFAAAFVQGKPQSRNGPTDVFFSRIAG